MPQRPTTAFLLAVMCLILSSAGNAQYMHNPPTGMDLVSYGGNANTLVVQIVNVTPYPIQFKSASTSTSMRDEIDRDRKTKKSFMFAPVGVPQVIPAAPAQAFVPEYLSDGKTKNPDWIPNYVNKETRPYAFVLSWDDKGGYVGDTSPNWLTWTLKGVDCLDYYVKAGFCQPKADVDLGLFIKRQAAENLGAGHYWELVKTFLVRTLQIVSVVVAPEDPLAWAHFFLGTGEFIDAAGFNAEQLTPDEGSEEADAQHEKWYIAAFPIPDVSVACYSSSQECIPTTEPTNDAVQVGWSAQGGVVQSQIVVTTHLLRGQTAQHSVKEYYCDTDPAACRGKLGSVPIAMVTVMTTDLWLTSNLAGVGPSNVASSGGNAGELGGRGFELIRSILQQYGRAGLLTLMSILHDLPREQREEIRDLVNARRAGTPLTPRQEALVYMVAVRLRAQMK
jgi:hypothetical protein